jgi:hypothetical protein
LRGRRITYFFVAIRLRAFEQAVPSRLSCFTDSQFYKFLVVSITFGKLIFNLYNTEVPVVLHGCETWFLTLREEHRLRVFENGVLRTLFGPKRDEETGGWRNLQNEELHNLYSSLSIITVTAL